MIVGNPSVFALESCITEAYEKLSLRALGYFNIHVGGKRYGVYSPDASMLACSFDTVQTRIVRRGMHCAPFVSEPNAAKIADAYLAAIFDSSRQDEIFFGLSDKEFNNVIYSNEICWAPDGDEAFDDGSYVLQFDDGSMVRLIAFKNERYKIAEHSFSEIWISGDEYYGILNKWQRAFEAEWMVTIKQPNT